MLCMTCLWPSQLRKAIENYQGLEMESAQKLKSLQEEMLVKINETRVQTEARFSSMIKNYNEAKRKAAGLEYVAGDLKREIKKMKSDMVAMVAAIKPTVKETEKAVIIRFFY